MRLGLGEHARLVVTLELGGGGALELGGRLESGGVVGLREPKQVWPVLQSLDRQFEGGCGLQ